MNYTVVQVNKILEKIFIHICESNFIVSNTVCVLFILGEGYKPKMAVVVVQKRISTRIFGKGSNGYDNPPPGTIIDHTITRKGW